VVTRPRRAPNVASILCLGVDSLTPREICYRKQFGKRYRSSGLYRFLKPNRTRVPPCQRT
jgi:hypothetical protein